MTRSNRVTMLAALSLAAFSAAAQVSPQTCGPVYVQGAFGPYDYRTDKSYLPVVERAHFTASVEALIRGKTGSRVEPDLDYTLRRFPNHHRALAAVLRHSRNLGRVHIPHLPLPVECYFERALRFKPDDVVARMIYVRFLVLQKRLEEARGHLLDVEKRGADSPLTLQNAGLLYASMGDFAKARELAQRIEETSLGDNKLKAELVARGQWRDARPPSAPPPNWSPAAAPPVAPGSAPEPGP